jgi:hypothetical protein
MVRNDFLCLVKPPGTGLVQNLSFERNGGENTIKRTLTISGDKSDFIVFSPPFLSKDKF